VLYDERFDSVDALARLRGVLVPAYAEGGIGVSDDVGI
jgi:hypothetical protein